MKQFKILIICLISLLILHSDTDSKNMINLFSKSYDVDVFQDDGNNKYTYDSMIKGFEKANDQLPSILKNNYGVSDYSKSSSFKFKVCGAKVYNCYTSNNDKYFISNERHIDKQGKFYFGLLFTQQSKYIISSIGWCESGFKPDVVSGDGGYGIYQITPSAIGDANIKKSKLLDPEYNIQYGIYHTKKQYDYVVNNYDKYKNIEDNQNFTQYLAVRGYNGGFKQISRIIDRDNDPIQLLFSGNYIEQSSVNGRFICFERVNTVYPLKIQTTYKYLSVPHPKF